MSNSVKKKSDLVKAERRLKRARGKFEATREQYMLIRERGKQQVERAQLEADRRLTKANERLEKRAHALNRAEEKMLAFGTEQALQPASGLPIASNDRLDTPEHAADAIEQLQEEHGRDHGSAILHGE